MHIWLRSLGKDTDILEKQVALLEHEKCQIYQIYLQHPKWIIPSYCEVKVVGWTCLILLWVTDLSHSHYTHSKRCIHSRHFASDPLQRRGILVFIVFTQNITSSRLQHIDDSSTVKNRTLTAGLKEN